MEECNEMRWGGEGAHALCREIVKAVDQWRQGGVELKHEEIVNLSNDNVKMT